MTLSVDKQSISVTDPNILVSGTVNDGDLEGYWCNFQFEESWDMFGSKTAVFKRVNSENSYPVVISNNRCMIPPEVLNKEGYLKIGVFGTSDENVYPTVWSENLQILKGCYTPLQYPQGWEEQE